MSGTAVALITAVAMLRSPPPRRVEPECRRAVSGPDL